MNIYITHNHSINPLVKPEENCLPAFPEKINGTRLSCLEPDYKTYIKDPGARRRMSRAVRMGVSAALQCLSASESQPDAIITASGLGCLTDTEKFLRTIIDTREQLLNPTPFIQSTFNTVGAQTAMMSGNMNYNMTYVHRGFSFENALLDALMKLWEKESQNILVGTYEETTDTSYNILSRLGYCKKSLDNNLSLYENLKKGSISGEGAHFFILSSATKGNCILKDISTLYHPAKEDINPYIHCFLQKNQLQPNDIDILISGENGDPRDQPFYDIAENILDRSTIVRYKSFFGEYPTVTAAAMWLGTQILNSGNIPDYLLKKNKHNKMQHILLYNHHKGKNHSLTLLKSEELRMKS